MFVVIVGCGRVGAELAFRLFRDGHQVAVIDQVGGSFGHLHPEYRGRTIEGEVLAHDVLARAGTAEADGLAAVTNSDPVNAVVGHVARAVFHVPNVVVRNYDPRWLPMHEAFGNRVVASTAWGAQRIEDLLRNPHGRSVLTPGNGEVQIYEVTVPEAWAGPALGQLLGPGCVAASITRGGRSGLPDPGEGLRPGDVLHVSATYAGIEALRRRLGARPPAGGEG